MENTQKQNNKQTKKVVKKEGFLKKYWHIIVICLLFVFAMSQCTRSCTRNSKIKTQNIEIQKRDSTINSLTLEIDTLKNNLNYYTALYNSERSHNSNFASIATGNQNELYNQMNELNNQILTLQNKNTLLNKENSMLRDSISYYKYIKKEQ